MLIAIVNGIDFIIDLLICSHSSLLFSLINKENSDLISHSLAELVLAISKFPISKFTDRNCLSSRFSITSQFISNYKSTYKYTNGK